MEGQEEDETFRPEQSGLELQSENEREEQKVEKMEIAEREDGVRRREVFGNIEIRQFLNLSPPRGTDYASFYSHVVDEFQNAVERAAVLAGPRDIIQVEVRGESLQNNISMIRRDGAENLEQFQPLLDQLVQSNSEISMDHSLEVVIQIVRNQAGGMGQKRKLKSLMDCDILKKKGRFLYIVDNTDSQMCFSITVAHLLDPSLNDTQASQWGAEIHRSAELSADSPVTLEDVSKFEKVLGCRIVVFYRHERDGKLSKFTTEQSRGERTLLMFLYKGHYYGIKNLKGFLGNNFVCESCFTGYDRRGSHSCSDCCSVCCNPDCPKQPLKLTYCPDCNRTCRSAYCFKKHRESKEQPQSDKTASRCEMVKKCRQCKFVYYTEPHKCPETKCNICHMLLPKVDPEGGNTSDPHRCYIQPDIVINDCENLVFYDFETFVDEKGEHVPFYVSTSTSGGELWCAEGTDCAVKFLQHFRQPRYKNFTFIAHNSKGFDSYLVLKPMVEQNVTPSLIAQGSKIICFQDPDFKQRYIDSLSFLPMRLAQLPEALGFENSVKGYFPHHFSSENNLKYVGPYPPPEVYGADHMSVSDREKFLAWYQTVKDGVFDFHKEVKLYCQNDTDILKTACLKFRDQFIADTKVDPFSCVTIASACMKVFRSNYMPLNSIAIPSPDNYRTQSKPFSSGAIHWLEWEAHNRGVSIQHALNHGERQFGPYFVDGYAVVKNEDHVLEFLGCFYHGCPTCFNPKDIHPLTKVPFREMYMKTMDKLQILESFYKLKVTHLWEHEWNEMKENDQQLRTFLEKFEPLEPLVPRDALYGGRTSAIRLRYTAEENDTVSYVDVNSLYPHVMCDSECDYPLDHPTILHTDLENPQNYFGLIRAKVYPPRGLFFPVLPFRTSKGKLLFTLCRLCGELNNQKGSCSHTEEERALTGVWVTPEFNKAVELGYQIGKIHEIWHFPKKSNTIFKDYMCTFLKGKQEASGYPSGVQSEESRQKYISEYLEQQGIQLEPSKISFNPAKRQIAKLCLNSLWGKFGQRSNQLTSTLIRTCDEFNHYLFSNKYDISYFTFIGDQVALIQWKYNKKYTIPPGNVNVFLAAFTTAYGRLALYKYLSQLQDRVLYHDTDSLVYVSKLGEYQLPMGEQLGELKDELNGNSIIEWVSSGPKSYAYQTSSGKVTLKAKGITQNYENCQQVCFDSLRDLVEGYIDHQNPKTADEIITYQHTIVRDKKGFRLRNATLQKRYRVVYDKRRLLPHGTTLPFGY